MAIVHHTAGSNDIAEGQDVLDLIYAYCLGHVVTRGWWDIAYNFLIDPYGTIYEGRRGSIEAQIRGGHTAGFNSYSFGVALIGNFEETYRDGSGEYGIVPTQASLDALEELLAWRMDRHHISASELVTVVSLDPAENPKWPEGTDVEFDRITTHRDARKTACPGNLCYALIPGVRVNVAAAGEPKFTADFSDFDPLIPGTPGDLVLSAPADAAWTVSVTRRLGATVWTTAGTGPDTVSWDAQVAPGPYTVRIDIGSLGVHEQVVQVGDYEWPFVDDEGTYALEEINEMWNRGVTVGCDWNRFCPNGNLTRAEIATFVARAMDGEHHYPDHQGYYSDVASGWWYTGAIEYLVEEGMLPGGGGVYGVNESATRTMVVELVMGVIGDTAYPEYQAYFTDVAEGMWYTPIIERAHELGIALGYPDESFRPDNFLTREEAAAFIMRGLD